MSLPMLSTSSVTGTDVKNLDGENIGSITDIMLDTGSGTIAYAVLSFGGFMGLGDKLFAIPWAAFSINTEDETFILNIDKASLEKAEGFDQDDWPDMRDVEWNRRTYSQYGYEPYWD